MLLFCATAPAIAHEEHEKKAQEAASEHRGVEESNPFSDSGRSRRLFMRTGAIACWHALLFGMRIGAGTALLAAVLGWFFAGLRLGDDEWVMTAH